ncbi:hypothetical protein RSK20926_02302 [Roseobacter sp. SK209-2-6]|uniref:hypothetical protein n=1 Tax=Roseobacter sp. SK209-2-6 TaxID=388739 RepID=UPI0000F3E431|nr:hypothetical protein [Roseobacter sp. SK209-2-6]EBA14463.1 hypothetical protein RSK20926_02302 [Roseobacter sp. SK209-2-6]
MKPGFALSLSAEGIVLLHRAAGGWRNVGQVPLEAADLPSDLAALKAKGEALEPGGTCKLIIPNDQIRYLSIDTNGASASTCRDMARQALEGATPYPVDELAFDLSEDGNQTHIAAVALETLTEAESFAVSNGFTPASFVAAPGDMGFLGEPFFGPTAAIGTTLVEADGIAVVDIGPAEIPVPAAPATKSADKVDPPKESVNAEKGNASGTAEEAGADEADDLPIAGFSSRRRRPAADAGEKSGAAPSLQGVRKTTPEVTSSAATPAVKTPAGSNKTPVGPASKPTPPSTPSKKAPAPNPGKGSSAVAPPPVTPPAAVSASPPNMAASVAVVAKAADGVAPSATIAIEDPTQLEHKAQRGKPRFLGLFLTAALLLFMAVIAAFALFSPTGFFSSPEPGQQSQPEQVETLPAQETDGEEILENDPAELPNAISPQEDIEIGIAPQVSALPDQPDPGISELAEQAQPETAPDPDSQSSTDQAVLDALVDPENDLFLEDSLEEAETAAEAFAALDQAARYAATGIWSEAPTMEDAPALVDLDNIYVASIDNANLSQDAVALPASDGFDPDAAPGVQSSPAAAGNAFELDERGLVIATPEGTLNPDGVLVYLGRPEVVPPPTPERADPATVAEEAEAERLAVLSKLRPRLRPGDLIERAERAQLGGLSREELSKVRPKLRPQSLKTEEQENQPVSALAVTTSASPRARPANFANLVDRATRQQANSATAAAAVATVAPATVTPSIPSSASVARQATLNNAINLRRLNLIGVYGNPSNRSALIRMPSGRFRKVQVGDRLDGGKVIAISETQLRYEKRGKSTTLKMPGG